MEKKKYTPGRQVQDAKDALEAHKGKKPGDYHSQWQAQADDLLGKIQNRGPFSYDAARDPMYRQAVNQYIRLGRQAMMDSAGQAAALTGGYGNSYSQTVGQQTYQGYLQDLAGKLPQFQNMALQRYQAQGKDLMDRYQALSQREKQAYGQYQKILEQYYAQQDRLQGAYDREHDRDYNRFVNDRDYQYAVDRDAAEAAARAEQARKEQERWEADRQYQKDRDKIRDEQWQAQFDENRRRYEQDWAAKHSGGGSGGGGGGGRAAAAPNANLRKFQDKNDFSDSEFRHNLENAKNNGHYGYHFGGDLWKPRDDAYKRPFFPVTIR